MKAPLAKNDTFMRKEWSRVSFSPVILQSLQICGARAGVHKEADSVSFFYILLNYMRAHIHGYLSTFPSVNIYT